MRVFGFQVNFAASIAGLVANLVYTRNATSHAIGYFNFRHVVYMIDRSRNIPAFDAASPAWR